jgi:HEPN domain-containing protein
MIDIEKQVAHWRLGATEAWDEVPGMIRRGRTSFALFFLHLALEKALKAHVCRQTSDLAPKIHDLVALARLTQLPLSKDQADFLAAANAYNIAGRYSDAVVPAPTRQAANQIVGKAKEVFEWLISRL